MIYTWNQNKQKTRVDNTSACLVQPSWSGGENHTQNNYIVVQRPVATGNINLGVSTGSSDLLITPPRWRFWQLCQWNLNQRTVHLRRSGAHRSSLSLARAVRRHRRTLPSDRGSRRLRRLRRARHRSAQWRAPLGRVAVPPPSPSPVNRAGRRRPRRFRCSPSCDWPPVAGDARAGVEGVGETLRTGRGGVRRICAEARRKRCSLLWWASAYLVSCCCLNTAWGYATERPPDMCWNVLFSIFG